MRRLHPRSPLFPYTPLFRCGSTFAAPPQRFEAGVPMTAQAIGLGAAVDYLSALGMANVDAHEKALTGYALEKLAEIPGVSVIGDRKSTRLNSSHANISYAVF